MVVLAVACFVAPGCGKKSSQPVTVKEWERYQDPYYKLSFEYPKGWFVSADGAKVSVYSSKEAADKFFDPYSANKKDGVEIVVAAEKLDSAKTLDQIANDYKNDLTAQGFQLKAAENKPLANLDGRLVSVVGAYSKETVMHKTRIMAVKDSVLYYIQFSAFNDLYEPHRAVFDSVLASVRMPKPKSAEEIANPALPSQEMEAFDNYALRIMYPNNFDAATPKPKGEAKFSLELRGYRQDCTIRIDILPSKGLTVDKVLEQNLKFYKATGKGESKIGGLKALYLNYNPTKGIISRAYFVVKGDKMARVIMNIYEPMRADFLPVFEKSIASLQLK